MDSSSDLTQRFRDYFDREIANRAAKSLADGVQIEIKIQGSDGSVVEQLLFTRKAGRNEIIQGPAPEPQIIFVLTPAAAEEILNDPADQIGTIGVNIVKLIASPDANRRVSVKLRTGFMTLFNKGYFGVLANGGQEFAAFLASKGLGGIGAIKDAIKNLRS